MNIVEGISFLGESLLEEDDLAAGGDVGVIELHVDCYEVVLDVGDVLLILCLDCLQLSLIHCLIVDWRILVVIDFRVYMQTDGTSHQHHQPNPMA